MAKRTMERNWEEQTITILEREYDYAILSPKMKDMCGFLGFGTKLVDVLAGMKAYSIEEKREKVDKVFDSLLKDEWRVPGQGRQNTKKELEEARRKMDEAKANASESDLEVLKRLGLD